MMIVVSDVHLGYAKSNRESFRRFLEQCASIDIDTFIVLGDLLDFWRCNNAEAVIDNQDVLDLIGRIPAKSRYYLPGNHDIYVHKLAEIYGDQYPFLVRKWLTLDDGGSRIHFRHGYELEVLANLEPMTIESYERLSERMCFTERITGGILSEIWELIENRNDTKRKVGHIRRPPHERDHFDRVRDLAISKGAYLLLGMHPGDKLVYGHTHRPFINDDQTVANTGAWVDEGPPDRPRNTYIVIDRGQIKLRRFDIDPFP